MYNHGGRNTRRHISIFCLTQNSFSLNPGYIVSGKMFNNKTKNKDFNGHIFTLLGNQGTVTPPPKKKRQTQQN